MLIFLSRILMFDALLSQLETDLQTALGTCVAGLVATARARLEDAHADVAKERSNALAEVAEERDNALAEVDARRAELDREVATMHKHKEAHEGRVELNIGGHRFVTSVQTMRRVPHTFFDAYFSGRYALDVCNDGSIFVDRDGEHFGHVLEYMRDGFVSVAEAGARPSVSLLRALKREFGFYCIELCADQPEETELAFIMGGEQRCISLSSMERYYVTSDKWSAVAAMGTPRSNFGACVIAGEIYVTGGIDADFNDISSMERYSILSDTWSDAAPLPEARSQHTTVAVGSSMYVLGGTTGEDDVTTPSMIKFDSVQGTWSDVAPMPSARRDAAACAIGNNIFVFGGHDDRDDAQDSVLKYDTETDEWSTLAPMPDASSRYNKYSASVHGGLVYIIGFRSDNNDFFSFDPASGVWSTLAPTLHNRSSSVSFVLAGYLYAAGGFEPSSVSSVDRYDVASDTWTAVANFSQGRLSCCAVTIGSSGPAEEQDLFDSLIAEASSLGRV
jgi:N-acetylneuraminic acid mutarotase